MPTLLKQAKCSKVWIFELHNLSKLVSIKKERPVAWPGGDHACTSEYLRILHRIWPKIGVFHTEHDIPILAIIIAAAILRKHNCQYYPQSPCSMNFGVPHSAVFSLYRSHLRQIRQLPHIYLRYVFRISPVETLRNDWHVLGYSSELKSPMTCMLFWGLGMLMVSAAENWTGCQRLHFVRSIFTWNDVMLVPGFAEDASRQQREQESICSYFRPCLW